MGAKNWRQTINLIDDIIEDGESYDFFQAIRLLNRLSKDSSDNKKQPELRIHPELNLSYPHSDITEVRKIESGYEIISTFFGLYGISSPLPGYFTEELLDEEWEERNASKEFLDIIHHHMYPLLYKAWLKYKFSHNAIEEENSRYWEILYSVTGLSEEFRSNQNLAGKLLKYSGILCQQPKTQLGLKTILKDYFNDAVVDIVPCVHRKVPISDHQRCVLGKENNSLGNATVIGQQVDDRSGKFVIEIGPVSRSVFENITNDDATRTFVSAVTKLFLSQPLAYDIILKLEPGAEKNIMLGDVASSTLGRNAWMVGVSSGQTNNLTMPLTSLENCA
ncbi:MAG: type VI secretion system baseplate subunit TssG [Gammaproteobacteria bacterium]|nr:type VI secretion system baseplate subunit TssG [Gammaproteobacteria bacterium]